VPYNIQIEYDVDGRIARSRLWPALADITARHAMLRAHVDEPTERQVINEEIRIPLRIYCGLSEADITELAAGRARTIFDRSTAPLWDCMLLTTAKGRQVIVLTFDHMIMDGYSVRMFMEELAAGPDRSDEMAEDLSYGQFVAREADNYGSCDSPAMSYWREHLRGGAMDRPVLFPFCPQQAMPLSGWINRRRRELGEAVSLGVRASAATLHVTVFLYFLAAVMAGLAALSGERDITVRLPVNGRTDGFERTIGWLANLVQFRLPSAGAGNLEAVVADVRRSWIEQLPHHSVPYDSVRECISPQYHDPASRPAIVTVAANTAPTAIRALGARLIPCVTVPDSGQGDEAGLQITLVTRETSLEIWCRYDPGRYPESAIDQILDSISAVLTS